MDDAAAHAFDAWPERLYVIDADGTIAWRGGRGPNCYDPAALESWLETRFEQRARTRHGQSAPIRD